jgi:predicted DNA-binding protein YlxM (UPF0122 family)
MGTYQEKVMTFVDDIEMKDYAFTLLGLMSEADRILVELYYFDGLKYKEIGKRFEVCGARVSQAFKELRRVVSRLDIRKEVKWRSVVTNKSILYNHDTYARNKFIKKRKEEKDACNAFDGNTRAFEQWCFEHYRSEWKYRMENGLYVHPRFRRLYYENLELFKDV